MQSSAYTESPHFFRKTKPLEDSDWIFEVCNMPFVWHIRSHLPCWRQTKKVIRMKRNQTSRDKKVFPAKKTVISKQGTKQAGVQRNATKSFKVSLHQTLRNGNWLESNHFNELSHITIFWGDLLCSIRLIENLKGHSSLIKARLLGKRLKRISEISMNNWIVNTSRPWANLWNCRLFGGFV